MHNGYIKLADFGTSKFIEVDMKDINTCKGTPGFAAPEVLRG